MALFFDRVPFCLWFLLTFSTSTKKYINLWQLLAPNSEIFIHQMFLSVAIFLICGLFLHGWQYTFLSLKFSLVNPNSILSSVFLTTESHEKRMRVADQYVCVSLTVSRCGYLQSLNPYKSAPSLGFSIFYIPGEEGKAKFYNLPDFSSTTRVIPSQNVRWKHSNVGWCARHLQQLFKQGRSI